MDLPLVAHLAAVPWHRHPTSRRTNNPGSDRHRYDAHSVPTAPLGPCSRRHCGLPGTALPLRRRLRYRV